MAIHSSILAWRIPWIEELGGLQSMESQNVELAWEYMYTHSHTRVACSVSVEMLFVCSGKGHLHVCHLLSVLTAALVAGWERVGDGVSRSELQTSSEDYNYILRLLPGYLRNYFLNKKWHPFLFCKNLSFWIIWISWLLEYHFPINFCNVNISIYSPGIEFNFWIMNNFNDNIDTQVRAKNTLIQILSSPWKEEKKARPGKCQKSSALFIHCGFTDLQIIIRLFNFNYRLAFSRIVPWFLKVCKSTLYFL